MCINISVHGNFFLTCIVQRWYIKCCIKRNKWLVIILYSGSSGNVYRSSFPSITNIVNSLSLSSGQFHHILKQSTISSFLEKPTLDKDQLSSYRPISKSNLSLISKIIESIVKSRLSSDHLSSNNLLNPHQSAYCKHHSTETALSYIHDHLINATGSQQISRLCLLDLSTATPLTTTFSSLVSHKCSILQVLPSRSFHVKCTNCLSSSHICSYGFPQGSVRPWSYTFHHVHTPLNTLILSQLPNHHFYADVDTAFLFFLSTWSSL